MTAHGLVMTAPNFWAWSAAGGEVLTGDARGEAEVVLDPRARGGLSADRRTVQGERPEALRRGVHGGGQPRRAGADDHDVIAALRDGVEGEAELDGDVARCGPPEHPRRGDHDRQVVGADPQPVEQHGDVGVGLRVDPAVGESVAAGVLPQCHRGRREHGSDDLQRVGRGVLQGGAPGDERLENGVAEPHVAQHPAAEDLRGTTTTSPASTTLAVRYGR